MTTTVTIQIGNSDNKLSQREWSDYAGRMRLTISRNVDLVHFSGGSDWDSPWQNACWVCEVETAMIESLKKQIAHCRKNFNQDSVAVTYGETVMV